MLMTVSHYKKKRMSMLRKKPWDRFSSLDYMI
jgi:hypothetical protein